MSGGRKARQARSFRGHIPPVVFVDGARGVASLRASRGLLAHLEACAACRNRLELWSGFASLARRTRRVSIPDEVVSRARALVGRTRVSPLTQAEAVIGYQDEHVLLPARGRRTPEQLVYEAGGVA